MYIYMHRYIHICITFSSNSEYSGLPKAKKNSKFLFRSTKGFVKEPLGLELKDIAAYVPVFVCSHLTRPIWSVVCAHFGPARVTHVCTYSFMKIKTATKPRNRRQKTENKGEKKREKETSIKERSFRQTSDKTFKIRHGCKYAPFHGRARTDIIEDPNRNPAAFNPLNNTRRSNWTGPIRQICKCRRNRSKESTLDTRDSFTATKPASINDHAT